MFPENYPDQGPKAYTVPPLFHPNVYPSGEICSSILSSSWSSDLSISEILSSLQILFANPNPLSPANAKAYEMFISDRTQFASELRKCVSVNSSLESRSDTTFVKASELKNRYFGLDVIESSENQQKLSNAL